MHGMRRTQHTHHTQPMQRMRRLERILDELCDSEHYMFSGDDIHALFPDLNRAAVKALLSRAAAAGVLTRVCHGLYLYPRAPHPRGLVLYHAAAKIRSGRFNYLSLESVLSDAGVISQVPINWITVMSSGRSYVMRCSAYGSIEFVHTKKQPNDLAGDLRYDARIRMWRASPALALSDMRQTRRPMDLIDWSLAHELA